MSESDDKRPSGPGGRPPDAKPQRHGTVALVFACALPVAVLVLPTVAALIVAMPVLGIGAVVSALLARRTARTSGGSAPGTTTAITVGAVGLVVSLVVAPFWQSLSSYETCVDSALTMQDKQNCREALDHSVSSRVPFAHISMIMDRQG